MKPADIPTNEAARLAALYQYEILDTDYEKEFDDLVKLASQICEAPISLISLVEENRQWFKAQTGLDVRETSRDVSFCSHAILGEELMIVEDATKDERFRDNPLVLGDPNIRFYAGMPLKTPGQFKIGTLCIIDDKPRHLTEEQRFALHTISDQVIKLMEHKQKVREVKMQQAELQLITKEKNKILTNILQDIQNPLTILQEILSLFSEDELKPEDFKYVFRDAENGIRNTSHLLKLITYWAERQVSSDLPPQERVFLNILMDSVISSFSSTIESRSLSVQNNIPRGLQIYANPHALSLIFGSLLMNAIIRIDIGQVSITGSREENQFEIRFTDEGTILREDEIEYLLEGNSEEQDATRGFGWGVSLVIAQELAKEMGAILEANSRSNPPGMTFILRSL